MNANKSLRSIVMILGGICLTALTGCASEIVRAPTSFTKVNVDANAFSIKAVKKDVRFTLQSGYRRLLKQNSRWKHVGDVPQGQVYAPVDTVFTVEGAQVYEAYLVVKKGNLTGFYLPVQQAYSGLAKSLHIELWEDDV